MIFFPKESGPERGWPSRPVPFLAVVKGPTRLHLALLVEKYLRGGRDPRDEPVPSYVHCFFHGPILQENRRKVNQKRKNPRPLSAAGG